MNFVDPAGLAGSLYYGSVISNSLNYERCGSDGKNTTGQYHYYTGGVLTDEATFKAMLGQGVKIQVKNINILGTTVTVTANDLAKSRILLPQASYEFKFTSGGVEPQPWIINIGTTSDAFIILYHIKSTWVPGMPPNR